MKRVIRLYHTLRYLKTKQFVYRGYYSLRNSFRKLINYNYIKSLDSHSFLLNLKEGIFYTNSYNYTENSFMFIGLSYKFKNEQIDWNCMEHGRLWNYNLTYFDFLLQKDMSREVGIKLISNFIDYSEPIRGKRMPYPISLRNINFIKFIIQFNIQNKKIDDFIFAQYFILLDNIEYHILGNHLLENGFSLLFGAYYFEDLKLYEKASSILYKELEEQILEDGAHFELSPMYHQLMLFRLLDSINLLQNNSWKNQELLLFFRDKAELMMGWLKEISYASGEIPLLNDSSHGIAPKTQELIAYAKKLNLNSREITLFQSGYRKKVNSYYELILDVGNIGPDYIAGHAHSDTFNFELHINRVPMIVDTGISTYENNIQRQIERSTLSHNTVEIDGTNQSQIWGAFRVAQRAKIIYLSETNNSIEAIHDGYKQKGYLHTRKWIFSNKKIEIIDTVNGETAKKIKSYLHFHPNVTVEITKNKIKTTLLEITFENISNLSIESYNHSNSFNYKKIAYVAIIEFQKTMSMEINIQ